MLHSWEIKNNEEKNFPQRIVASTDKEYYEYHARKLLLLLENINESSRDAIEFNYYEKVFST